MESRGVYSDITRCKEGEREFSAFIHSFRKNMYIHGLLL